ncbi:MAG: glycerol-3-phosphate acyltransferase [Dehalococcoidia bacterium]
MTLAVVLIVAYLLGSIPTSYIVVYRLTGRDIRTMGTGNPGTMNVVDTVGMRAGIVVGLGDICKGMAAVGIAYLAGLDDRDAVLAGMCAVAGHDWSIFLRLDGGNGMAAAVGALIALLPFEALFAVPTAIALYTLGMSRRLAGIIGLLMVPTLAYTFEAPEMKLIGAVLLLTFTVVKIFRFEGLSPARPGR